jgi:pimeloyl-ACP methyl ester carboxylesterase
MADNTSNLFPNVSVEDFTVECSDGMKIACQRWFQQETRPQNVNSKKTRRRILCIHGFLDNCRTFWYLAPYLVYHLTEDTEIICLDLPGHGQSSHFGRDHTITCSTEYLYSILQVVQWLQRNDEERFTIIAHSMGAHLSIMFAASFPEMVESIFLIDGLGPDCAVPQDCSKRMRRHLEERDKRTRQKHELDKVMILARCCMRDKVGKGQKLVALIGVE